MAKLHQNMRDVYKQDMLMTHAAYARLRLNALGLPPSRKPLLSLVSRPSVRVAGALRLVFSKLANKAMFSLNSEAREQSQASADTQQVLDDGRHWLQAAYSKLAWKLHQKCSDLKRYGFVNVQLRSLSTTQIRSLKREKISRLASKAYGKTALRAGLASLLTHSRTEGLRDALHKEKEEFKSTTNAERDISLQEQRNKVLGELLERVKVQSAIGRLMTGALASRFRTLVEFATKQRREEQRQRLALLRMFQITRKHTYGGMLDVLRYLRFFKRRAVKMDSMIAKHKRRRLKIVLHELRELCHKRGWLVRRFVSAFSLRLLADQRVTLHQLHRTLLIHTQQTLLEKIGMVGETLSESSEMLSILTQRNLQIDRISEEKGLREKRSLLLYVFGRIDVGMSGKQRKVLSRLAEFASNVTKAVPILDGLKRIFNLHCGESFSRIYRGSVMHLEKELVAAIRQFKADAVTLGDETAAMGNAAVLLIDERRRVEEMRNREQKGRIIVQKTRYKLGKDNRTRIQYGLILEYWSKWRSKKKRLSLLKGILGNGRDYWLKRSHKMLEIWYRKTKELSGYRDGLKVLCLLAERSRKHHQGEAWRNVIDRGFFTEESQLLNRVAYIDRRIEGLYESQYRRKLLTLESLVGGLFEKKRTKNYEHFFSTIASKSSVRPANFLCGTIIQEKCNHRLLIECWKVYREQFKIKQAQTLISKRRQKRNLLSIFTLLNYNRCQVAHNKKLALTVNTIMKRILVNRCWPLFSILSREANRPPAFPLLSCLHPLTSLSALMPFTALSLPPIRPPSVQLLLSSLTLVLQRPLRLAFTLLTAPSANDMLATTFLSLKAEARLRSLRDRGVQSAASSFGIGLSLSRVHEKDGRSAREVGAMLARAFSHSHLEHRKRDLLAELDNLRPVTELLPIRVSQVRSPPPTKLLFAEWRDWAQKNKAARILAQLYCTRFEQRLELQTMFRKWAQLSGWEFNNPYRNGGYISIEEEQKRLEKARAELTEARNSLQVLKERQDKETLVSDKVASLKARVVKSVLHGLVKSRQEKSARVRLAQWYSRVFVVGFQERYSIPVVDHTLKEVQELLYLQSQEVTVLKQTVLGLRQSSGKHAYVEQELWRTREESEKGEVLLRLRKQGLQLLDSETENLQKQLRRLQTESQRLVQGGIEAFERDQGSGELFPSKHAQD